MLVKNCFKIILTECTFFSVPVCKANGTACFNVVMTVLHKDFASFSRFVPEIMYPCKD